MTPMTSEDSWLWDKVVEVYKTRITLSLAFVVATVSIAGYAIANKRPAVALLAAIVPILALAIDALMIHKMATPFLYRLFISQPEPQETEPLPVLFLAFGVFSSRFGELRMMSPGIERQKLFRSAYLKQELPPRMAVFGLGALGNVALWAFLWSS